MITGPIPNQDELLISIEIWQVLDKSNGIFTIPTIVRHQDKITMIKIQFESGLPFLLFSGSTRTPSHLPTTNDTHLEPTQGLDLLLFLPAGPPVF